MNVAPHVVTGRSGEILHQQLVTVSEDKLVHTTRCDLKTLSMSFESDPNYSRASKNGKVILGYSINMVLPLGSNTDRLSLQRGKNGNLTLGVAYTGRGSYKYSCEYAPQTTIQQN